MFPIKKPRKPQSVRICVFVGDCFSASTMVNDHEQLLVPCVGDVLAFGNQASNLSKSGSLSNMESLGSGKCPENT